MRTRKSASEIYWPLGLGSSIGHWLWGMQLQSYIWPQRLLAELKDKWESQLAWVLWPQFEGPERRISFQLGPDPPVLVDPCVMKLNWIHTIKTFGTKCTLLRTKLNFVTKIVLKYIHFWNSVFSFNENKVLQLMSAGASLERFGERDLVFIKWKSRKRCFKNELTLVIEKNFQNSKIDVLKICLVRACRLFYNNLIFVLQVRKILG